MRARCSAVLLSLAALAARRVRHSPSSRTRNARSPTTTRRRCSTWMVDDYVDLHRRAEGLGARRACDARDGVAPRERAARVPPLPRARRSPRATRAVHRGGDRRARTRDLRTHYDRDGRAPAARRGGLLRCTLDARPGRRSWSSKFAEGQRASSCRSRPTARPRSAARARRASSTAPRGVDWARSTTAQRDARVQRACARCPTSPRSASPTARYRQARDPRAHPRARAARADDRGPAARCWSTPTRWRRPEYLRKHARARRARRSSMLAALSRDAHRPSSARTCRRASAATCDDIDKLAAPEGADHARLEAPPSRPRAASGCRARTPSGPRRRRSCTPPPARRGAGRRRRSSGRRCRSAPARSRRGSSFRRAHVVEQEVRAAGRCRARK